MNEFIFVDRVSSALYCAQQNTPAAKIAQRPTPASKKGSEPSAKACKHVAIMSCAF